MVLSTSFNGSSLSDSIERPKAPPKTPSLVEGSGGEGNLDLKRTELLSERYLQAIEGVVSRVGGWENINEWRIEQNGGSFTGLRSLVVLVNTLAPLHAVPAFEVIEGKRLPVLLPLEPRYSAPPNITTKK